jgi:hypothetical protein
MTSTAVDIETILLHCDLYEEIYMEAPKDLTIGSGKNLIIRKTIYGQVQSARTLYENLINVGKLIGFHKRKLDPFLWTMRKEKVNHMLIIRMYVDDCSINRKGINLSKFD